jgi:hypothetical protein
VGAKHWPWTNSVLPSGVKLTGVLVAGVVLTNIGKTVPVGRCLWAGADSDTRRILDGREANQDPDGAAWIGLNHPRIS